MSRWWGVNPRDLRVPERVVLGGEAWRETSWCIHFGVVTQTTFLNFVIFEPYSNHTTMQQEKRRLLILHASNDVCGQEIDLIKAHAEMLGLGVVQRSVDSVDGMKPALKSGGCFEYLYLCSHGNRDGFEVGNEFAEWSVLATMVCESACLADESTFLVACCRGGLNRVAYDMLIACDAISYICGPSADAYPTDLTTAFVVFLTQIERKGADQCFAAGKASLAIDRKFLCFDRNIVEGQVDYQMRKNELCRQGDGIEMSPIPRAAEGIELQAVRFA